MKRLISAAAGATALALSLTACGGASDADDDGSKPAEREADTSVDMGEYADNELAEMVVTFYVERQKALADGDLSEVEPLVTDAVLRDTKAFVRERQGEESTYRITVKLVEDDAVFVCLGPKGTEPRRVSVMETVDDGNRISQIAKPWDDEISCP